MAPVRSEVAPAAAPLPLLCCGLRCGSMCWLSGSSSPPSSCTLHSDRAVPSGAVAVTVM